MQESVSRSFADLKKSLYIINIVSNKEHLKRSYELHMIWIIQPLLSYRPRDLALIFDIIISSCRMMSGLHQIYPCLSEIGMKEIIATNVCMYIPNSFLIFFFEGSPDRIIHHRKRMPNSSPYHINTYKLYPTTPER
jgi:hypothetical protein